MSGFSAQVKQQLAMMGFAPYMTAEALECLLPCFGKDSNSDELLMACIEWVSVHEITLEEKLNNSIVQICQTLSVPRMQALYALEMRENDEQKAMEFLVFSTQMNMENEHENNNESQPDSNIFSFLTNSERLEIEMRDSLITAKLASVRDMRKTEQISKYMLKEYKSQLTAELKSMGFLKFQIENALAHISDHTSSLNLNLHARTIAENQKLIKKTVIQYITTNPLSATDELNAKTKEILQMGFSSTDSYVALQKFGNDLNRSCLWLLQSRPMHLNFYLYHLKTESVLQIDFSNNHQIQEMDSSNHMMLEVDHDHDGDGNANANANEFQCENENENENKSESITVGIQFSIQVNSQIASSNRNQFWSYYSNGVIKNFQNNLLLTCVEKNDNFCVDIVLDTSIHTTTVNSENSENGSNRRSRSSNHYWDINFEEKIIQHRSSSLYLVYRENRLRMESRLLDGDMNQRWCFATFSDVIQLNPHQLCRDLDDVDCECIICFDREPNLRIEPCGHNQFCEECMSHLQPSECPICRAHISTTIKF